MVICYFININHGRFTDCPACFLAIYINGNSAALLLLWLCTRYPHVGRVGFSLFFAASCWPNISLATQMSWLYAKEAEFITVPYDLALGEITKPILWITAICQGLAAMAMTLKGKAFILGCWCGMVLCLALIPLGLRAAFPAPVVAALALYYLQGVPKHTYP
jgi:hypothetical protein